MLGAIRKITQGPGAYALLAVIILPLSFFGFNWLQVDSGAEREELGEINGEEINVADLQHRATIELEALEAQGISRDRVDPERFQRYVFQRVALDRLLQQEAKRRRIDISLDEIDRSIIDSDQFRDGEGRFSQGLFRQRLANQNYTPADYREAVRAELLKGKLLNSYQKFGFLTETERKWIAEMHQQRRYAVYAIVNAAALRDGVEVSEEELRAHYEKNKDKYISEEQVIVNYLSLERRDYYQEVPEEIVRGYYEDELNQIRERKHISHILLEVGSGRDDAAAQSELAALRERIVAGEDFAELARKYSEDLGSAENGGDLGWFTLEVFPDDVAVHLVDIKPGELSQPARSDSGWHLFYSHDDLEIPSYEERRDELYEVAQYLDSDAAFRGAIKNVSVELFDSNDLGSTADLLGKDILTSEKFGKKGTEDWPFNNLTLIEAAFSEGVLRGENSNLISVGPDTYIALHLDEYFAVQAQSFTEAYSRVEKNLRVERARVAAERRAKSLVKVLKDGIRSPADFLEREGYEVNYLDGVHRDDGEVPKKILGRIFSMPKPDGEKSVVASVKLDDDRTAIVSLLKIGSAVKEEDLIRAAENEVRDEIGNTYASLLNLKLRIGAQLRYFPDENNKDAEAGAQ